MAKVRKRNFPGLPLLDKLYGKRRDCGGVSTMRLGWCSGAGLAVSVLLLWLPVGAGGGEMSLADCIDIALENNLTILGRKEAVIEAQTGISEARSGFLPNLSLLGMYNFAEKVQSISFPMVAMADSVPVVTTMDVEADFTTDYDFTLELNQPLYTGGRLSGSYKLAKYAREMAEADLAIGQADVAEQVIEAFYGLLLARESVTVARQAIETAEEFLRIVKARYDAGEASSFEVLRAEVEVSNLQPALVRAENAVALSELALKTVMGTDPDEHIDFSGSLSQEAFDVDLGAALQSALDNRAELRMIEVQKEMAGQGIKLAKAARLPTLSLSASYKFRADDLTIDSDRIEETYAGYLVLSLPLFDGFKAKSQISGAYSQLRQADLARAGLEDVIELEVRSAYLEIDAALETLKSQEKNIEMAEEGLEIANERYLQGYATNLEVMDAQLALTRARNNRIQALHDLSLAVARAKRSMGVLLNDYKAGARS
jgi:outer membrane protein TolC